MISFDRERIKGFLSYLASTYDIKALIQEAKKMVKALDWNPFKLDNPTEFATAWEETKNNFVVVSEFVEKIVVMIELAVHDLESRLSGPEKLEIAAQFLDDVVRLPLYLEWFDKAIFRLLLSIVVNKINATHGHVWPEEAMRLATEDLISS